LEGLGVEFVDPSQHSTPQSVEIFEKKVQVSLGLGGSRSPCGAGVGLDIDRTGRVGGGHVLLFTLEERRHKSCELGFFARISEGETLKQDKERKGQ
jgi:hypothetical protein